MITRNQALKFIKNQIKNKNIIKHMLAVEAVMKALAQHFESDKVGDWALAGLLHDADYTPDTPMSEQGVKVARLLEEKGFSLNPQIKQAMAAHNHETGVKPKSKMDWAIFCADSLTGLIVATALVQPEKKLSVLTVDKVLRKFKDKSFAKGTRRDNIAMCEEKLGLTLEDFIQIGLKSMQSISDDLNL